MEDHHYATHDNGRRSFDDLSHDSPADGGDHSSPENEDDVFSDDSPRSSMGSMSEGDHIKRSHNTRSPRISNIHQYDGEMDYIPTVKGTPRPPFRSPSSVKAMQMSSPPPSVMGTPRSGRRSALQSVSRLGSPSLSAQYSPKKTPPRFKRSTPPLVLLHVTVLPLRWVYGDVLDSAQPNELSDEAKSLRDAWRQLQDRNGDTVQDRGVLLPHPQNDFEMLEERLLEALDLPFKRRARILECGHYLGPSNEMSFADEMESEDEDALDDTKSTLNGEGKTHWCTTCHSEIRYDALGPGKIYHVKVYASNGLLKAGAWEACWKEMERVDVELQPVVDSKLHDELVRLAAEMDKDLHERPMTMDDDEEERDEELDRDGETGRRERPFHDDVPLAEEEPFMARGHTPLADTPYSSTPSAEERRRTEEQRYRDMYGETSTENLRASTGSHHRTSPGYNAQDVPPADGYSQQKTQQANKNASLPELLLEAAKVFMQDKKNLVIILLSVLTLLVALRGSGDHRRHDDITIQPIIRNQDIPVVAVPPVQNSKEVYDQVISEVPVEATAEAIEKEAVQEQVVVKASVEAPVEEPTKAPIDTPTEISIETSTQTSVEASVEASVETSVEAPTQSSSKEVVESIIVSTSTVVEIVYTPQVKIEGEDPCAAVEPQTVEKWMTATVTEKATVTHTETLPAETEAPAAVSVTNAELFSEEKMAADENAFHSGVEDVEELAVEPELVLENEVEREL